MSRSKKTGTDLELLKMQQVTRLLRELPEDGRERVVNWVAQQTWADEKPPAEHVSSAPVLS